MNQPLARVDYRVVSSEPGLVARHAGACVTRSLPCTGKHDTAHTGAAVSRHSWSPSAKFSSHPNTPSLELHVIA